MALQKQSLQLSISDGLDLKTDDKNVLPTRFLGLENIRFKANMAIKKRFGYNQYEKNILGGGDISNVAAATTLKNELLTFANDELYSYSDAEQQWINKGNLQPFLSSEETIISDSRLIKRGNFTILENFGCYVYERLSSANDSGWGYYIKDEISGSVLVSNFFTGTYSDVTVSTAGPSFFIFYRDAGNRIKYRVVSTGTINSISIEKSITSYATQNEYCILSYNDNIYIAYYRPSSDKVIIRYIDSIENKTTETIVETVVAAQAFNCALNIENDNIRLSYSIDTSGAGTTQVLKSILYSADLNTIEHALTVVDAAAASEYCQRVAAIEDPENQNRTLLIYTYQDISAPTITSRNIKKAYISNAGAATSPTFLLFQVQLNSKLGLFNNKVYFTVARIYTTPAALGVQSIRTLFMFDIEGNLVGRFLVDSGVAEQYDYTNVLNEWTILENSICIAQTQITDIVTNPDTPATDYSSAVVKCCIDFSTEKNYFDSTLSQNLHITGSFLNMYDSTTAVEHGFLEIPKTPVFVSIATGGSQDIGLGSIQFVYTYEWKDQFGQIHRSAPSIPMTYTNSTVNSNSITIRLWPCMFTAKENVELVVYRTLPNGLIFYKVPTTYATRQYNVKGQNYIEYACTTSDTAIATNEILYTDGGVLENIAPPSSRAITTYKNRIFLLDSLGKRIYYSKQARQAEPVQFNDALYIDLDERGGEARQLQAMDDHVIIFKENALFAVTGEGPNDLGEQDDFRQPYLITSDVGIKDINSIVITPMGLMFKSTKGIYILKRNLSVEYIGDRVEFYNSSTVTSATLLESVNEVRFTLDSGRVLVYDYYVNRWCTDTNIFAKDALIYRGDYVYIREDGYAYVENSSDFSDDGSHIPIKLESAWIQGAGIQNFQRVYKLVLVGKYKNAHKLKISFAYDFNPSWVDEVLVDATSTYGTNTYGTGTYGTGIYGDAEKTYQLEIRTQQQKCEALKFKIETVQDNASGPDMELSNINLTIGVKTGTIKLKDSKVFGAS